MKSPRSGYQVTSAVAGLLLASTATQALGGGIWLYEQGVPDLGMANAGRAALAENAATAGGNPAGLTRLKQSEVLAGIQPMFLDVKFDKDASTFGGGDGKNAGAFIPGGSFYYAHNTSPRLKLGFAAASTFGAGLDHSGQWAGRYYVTEVVFLTAKAGPSAGYRTPDMPLDRQWRIGIGLQHERSKDLSLGVAYEYVNMGDADIDRAGGPLTGSLKGSYSPYAIHIANVTMNWRF